MQEVSHNANPDLHPLSCFTYCIVHGGGSRGRGGFRCGDRGSVDEGGGGRGVCCGLEKKSVYNAFKI